MTNNKTLLVVDDQAEICELICELAEDLGFTCHSTTEAARCPQLVREIKPTVVVLDLQMPDTDGVELLRRLAQEGCQALVLIASGMSRRVLEAAHHLGELNGLHMLGFLEKPLMFDGLEQALRSLDER